MSPTRTAMRDGGPIFAKTCDECGKEGVATNDSDSDFYVNARHPDGSVRSWRRYCKACDLIRIRERRIARRDEINARKRERYAERRESDPEFVERMRVQGRERAAQYRRDPEKGARIRAASRRYHAKATAERPDEVRQSGRMEYALRAERAGRELRRRASVIDGTGPRIPADLFRRWLQAYKRLADHPTDAALARELGITERRLRSVLSGEYENVSLDVVDRALLTAPLTVELDGRPIVSLECLYPAA